MKKLGNESRIDLKTLNIKYGTCDRQDAKSFWINLSGWMQLSTNDMEDKKVIVMDFDKKLKHFLKAKANIFDDYLYSFVDMDINEALYSRLHSTGFFDLEITIMLSSPIINFKYNKDFNDKVMDFSLQVEENIKTLPMVKVTKRKVKKTAIV